MTWLKTIVAIKKKLYNYFTTTLRHFSLSYSNYVE